MEPQTDLDYNTGDDSGVLGDDNTKDVDYSNVSILVKHLKEIDKLIAKHNTFDVISLDAKFSAEQQVAVHKLFVTYLRLFREDIASKVKELTSGR